MGRIQLTLTSHPMNVFINVSWVTFHQHIFVKEFTTDQGIHQVLLYSR